MKVTKKFYLKPLTAISAFNYEIELPISDGVIIYYQEENGPAIDLLTLYLNIYSDTCELRINKELVLADHIKTYDEFKALDAAIEKAKYHIELANKAAITSAYLDD